MKNNSTNFGFEKVNMNDKQTLVNNIFSKVANKYDLMNDLMSGGMHRLWKNEFINQIPNLHSDILDVASGSGDIAFKIMKKSLSRNLVSNITICDINQEMLDVAKLRAIDNNLLHGLNYVCTNAENLPFPDESFDYYTIAFGIRNVANVDKALHEAYRVLRPMGKFLCLEFSKVENPCIRSIYDFYSFNIIPKIGQIVADNEEAYRYLVESINLFPDQDHFRLMIQDAGFSNARYKNLTFGVTAIHSAYKL